jgi:hypothetical protein
MRTQNSFGILEKAICTMVWTFIDVEKHSISAPFFIKLEE